MQVGHLTQPTASASIIILNIANPSDRWHHTVSSLRQVQT